MQHVVLLRHSYSCLRRCFIRFITEFRLSIDCWGYVGAYNTFLFFNRSIQALNPQDPLSSLPPPPSISEVPHLALPLSIRTPTHSKWLRTIQTV